MGTSGAVQVPLAEHRGPVRREPEPRCSLVVRRLALYGREAEAYRWCIAPRVRRRSRRRSHGTVCVPRFPSRAATLPAGAVCRRSVLARVRSAVRDTRWTGRRNGGVATCHVRGVPSGTGRALAGTVTSVGTVVLVPILAGLYVMPFPIVLGLVTGEEWGRILHVIPTYVWASVGVARTVAIGWSPLVGLVLVPLGALVGWTYQRGRCPRNR